MNAIYWALGAVLVFNVALVAVAWWRGRSVQPEAFSLIRTTCCHEYRSLEDVRLEESYPGISFVCSNPATCGRARVVSLNRKVAS